MDGVLTMNGHFHIQAWQRFARETLNLDLDDDPRVHGGRNVDILLALTGQMPDPEALLACEAAKEGYYRELARGKLRPVCGLHAYLDWLSKSEIPCALVTSADVRNTAFVLEELGLTERFAVKIGAEDVRRGKPDPEPYILAAARVGVDPALCVVHEDAPSGVQSALAAGCTVIALTTTFASPVLEAAGAQLCIPDFAAWLAEVGATGPA